MGDDAIERGKSSASHVVEPFNKSELELNPAYVKRRNIAMATLAPTKGQPAALEAPESILRMTPEERRQAEKLLIRKIDIRLLPMIILMYIMNYLDRNNIAAARIAGMEEELKLSSVQYLVSSETPFDFHPPRTDRSTRLLLAFSLLDMCCFKYRPTSS